MRTGERHHVDSGCLTCGHLLLVHGKLWAVQGVHAVCSFVADAQEREDARDLICVPRHEPSWTLRQTMADDEVHSPESSFQCGLYCSLRVYQTGLGTSAKWPAETSAVGRQCSGGGAESFNRLYLSSHIAESLSHPHLSS